MLCTYDTIFGCINMLDARCCKIVYFNVLKIYVNKLQYVSVPASFSMCRRLTRMAWHVSLNVHKKMLRDIARVLEAMA